MANQLPSHIFVHRSRFRFQRMVEGKLVRRSFATLAEAIEFRNELARHQDMIRASDASRELQGSTIGDIVREWWEGPSDVPPERRRGHRNRVSPRTQSDYQYLINKFIAPINAESARAYAEQPGLLKAYYDSFTARVSVWRVHAILRQAFEYAVERRWIDLNPAAIKRYHPARVKRRRKTKLVPSRDHVEKLIVAAYEQDESWGFFVYTLATLGLRCGEICALHWENLDFEAKEVEIEWAVATPKTGARELGSMFLKEPKVGESRTLPVGAEYFNAHGRCGSNGDSSSQARHSTERRTLPRRATAANRPGFGIRTKRLGVSARCGPQPDSPRTPPTAFGTS